MVLRPGRPFWVGFRAFAANMVALGGLDALNVETGELPFPWRTALLASTFVAAVVYGGEKIAEFNGNHKED